MKPTTDTVPCKTCGALIDPLDVFPKGNCLACHAAIWDKLPPQRPDFVKAVLGRRAKVTR